jgi:hypothetical protein
LLAVCQATGHESPCVPRVASGLGGGIGRQGEVCGALNGGALALGLLHVRRFAELNGALRCRDIIDLDASTEDGLKEYYERDLQSKVCNSVVTNAVRAVLELGDEVDP